MGVLLCVSSVAGVRVADRASDAPPPFVVLQLARAAALRDADDVAVFQKLPRAIELVVAVCMLGDKDGDTTPPSSDSDDF